MFLCSIKERRHSYQLPEPLGCITPEHALNAPFLISIVKIDYKLLFRQLTLYHHIVVQRFMYRALICNF